MVTIVCMFQVVSISSQYKVATYVIKCMLRVRNLGMYCTDSFQYFCGT
jgi:hypothetical protein